MRTTAEAQPAYVLIDVLPSVTRILHVPAIGKMVFPTAQDEIGMGKLIGLVASLGCNTAD